MPLVLAGATSGSTTIQATDAVTQTITLPNNTGTVLTTASTFAGTGPAFSVTKSSGQSITATTTTKVTFDTETFDTNNNFASSTFTPTVAGYYQINVKGWFTGTANRDYFLSPRLYKNGSAISLSGISIKALGSASELSVDLSRLVYMNGSTDYLEVYAYTLDYTLAASVDLAGGIGYTEFNGTLVRTA